ncbi:MAG: OprD family outer membrane porin [Nitritalea sp.]
MFQRILRFSLLVVGFFLSESALVAQHQELQQEPNLWRGRETVAKDTSSLLYALQQGRTEVAFRSMFIATTNEGDLTNAYALAAGGGLRYESSSFHGFRLAVSGFYIFNVFSSDLAARDPISGGRNRYEVALFDVQNPGNRGSIERLEEFHLKYVKNGHTITFGKQLINTPFINLQDGRMRPTGVDGLWYRNRGFLGRAGVEGGWIYRVTPRATTRWFSVAESIGAYGAGVNPDGGPAQYSGNVSSRGVAMLGINRRISPSWVISIWNKYTDNVFNTAMVQLDGRIPLDTQTDLIIGLQGLRQDALSDGGNPDQQKTYFLRGGEANTFGGRIGLRQNRLSASLNYNRITAHGRYLMPREWGREPFFTFMPRERNEGFGDVHAFMSKVDYSFPKQRTQVAFAAGYFNLPDVKKTSLNKYGVPSYVQLNTDIGYTFSNVLDGLEARILVVGKIGVGETYDNPIFVFNKVNMMNYNIVMNYHF